MTDVSNDRHSNQDTTDLSKIWEIKAHQLLIPSSTSTSTSVTERWEEVMEAGIRFGNGLKE